MARLGNFYRAILSGMGAPAEQLLEFLTIVGEEVNGAEMLVPEKYVVCVCTQVHWTQRTQGQDQANPNGCSANGNRCHQYLYQST